MKFPEGCVEKHTLPVLKGLRAENDESAKNIEGFCVSYYAGSILYILLQASI